MKKISQNNLTTSLIHKMPTKTPAVQTLKRTLSLPIYGGGFFFLFYRYVGEITGGYDHFPEWTGCKSWFFIISAGTKLKCAIKFHSPNCNFKKSNGFNYLYNTISTILTINAQKLQRSAGTWKFARYAMFLHYKAHLD